MQDMENFKISVKDFFENVELAKEKLCQNGIILLNGLDNDNTLDVAQKLGIIFHHKDANVEGIVDISVKTKDKLGANIRGFTAKALHPHTDRSVEFIPPDLVLFWCNIAAKQGGESVFIDIKKVCEHIKKEHPESFEKLCYPNSVIFSGGENKLYKGAIIEKLNDYRYMVRFRYDDLGFFSAEILDALAIFKTTLQKYSHFTKLSTGEGYIAVNTRWLHGRNEIISGSRSCGRILIHFQNNEYILKRGFELE